MARVHSVDVLRGLVMFLMALDHVRDYFGAATVNPTDIATTTVPLFLTRWITHLCAPSFFLLTGVSAFLAGERRGTEGLGRHLLGRGAWLLLLEVVILRGLAWQFNFDFRVTFLVVLWALGWAMITLSVLVRWTPRVAGVFGVVMIVAHNAFDRVNPNVFGALRPLWLILHQPGLIVAGPTYWLLVAYPLIPWVGVTAVGYALGQVFLWESERRRAFLLRVGLGLVTAFFVLRAVNVYGDPARWASQRSPVFTVLSFINTTKYPPSLLFLLMTLGPGLLILRATDLTVPRWLRPTIVLGKVPLFYFAAHVVLIHLLVLIVCWFRYGAIHWVFESARPDQFPFAQPPGWPLGLPWVYAIWLFVVAALWPVCRWFGALKARRREWWWSYL
ncbi:MAG: heparan-alpha-glucosaminide N-acetyltransferase domain-containing protein [Gemmatimonadaceae bacterium]